MQIVIVLYNDKKLEDKTCLHNNVLVREFW